MQFDALMSLVCCFHPGSRCLTNIPEIRPLYTSHIAILRESQLQFRIAAQEQAGQRDREFRAEIKDIEARHCVELGDIETRHGVELGDIEARHGAALKKIETQYQFQLTENERRHVAECARTQSIYEGGRRQLVSQLNAANQMVEASGARLEGYLLRQPIAAAPVIKGKSHPA